MGGLEKRIEALEYRWGMDEDREARERRTEAKRTLVLAKLQRVLDEEAWENPDKPSLRRAALEDLQDSMERRRYGA